MNAPAGWVKTQLTQRRLRSFVVAECSLVLILGFVGSASTVGALILMCLAFEFLTYSLLRHPLAKLKRRYRNLRSRMQRDSLSTILLSALGQSMRSMIRYYRCADWEDDEVGEPNTAPLGRNRSRALVWSACYY